MGEFNKWRDYWDNYLLNKYGKQEVMVEDDLYFQVARTIYKKPISKRSFDWIINAIVKGLSLKKDDIVVDICCGNGLFTYEMHSHVHTVVGIDFAPQIIRTAQAHKSADNIIYHLGEVIGSLQTFGEIYPGITPTKYLNNDSLAYFSPDELHDILRAITCLSGDKFHFLVRGVPNADLMWNYYDTEERKLKYHMDQANGDHTNDGLGRWWQISELTTICRDLGLRCLVKNQPRAMSNYRMDVLIKGEGANS